MTPPAQAGPAPAPADKGQGDGSEAAPDAPLLQATGLEKSYGGEPVLRGVDLRIAPGERVALKGPSGCGKTTLLNCLGGVDRPDAGSVNLAGRDLGELGAEGLAEVRRTLTGTVFQFFHLLPTLTAAENIELPLQLNGLPPPARAERVGELLRRIGLDHRAGAFPATLSGGEMQRVALARALAPRPRILFADEPTGSLDRASGAAALDLLSELAHEHGSALLLVTHAEDATRICERTLVMVDGILGPGEGAG